MKTIFTSKNKFTILLVFCLITSTSEIWAQAKHVVSVTNNVFTPDELKINVGDTVEWQNTQGFHNVNGTQSTFPDNPEFFGNSTGSNWVYSYVFTKEGKYYYQCDPHVNLGMTGKIEVEKPNDDDQKHLLTINFTGMNPHDGQKLYLSVIEKDSGKEIERKIEDINANFSVQISGIEKEHSYFINFFADHNDNGMYDAPPTDHAWRLELNNAMGDTTLNFAHNTNFTDIMWSNKLMVNFTGMNPHNGQTLHFRVVEQGSGTELFSIETTVSPEFSISTTGIEKGKSYNVDFYADHNGNGVYDAPPTDHAWRLELNNVVGDTSLNFTHNTNFTDIQITTGIEDVILADSRIYPNPATSTVKIEFANNVKNLGIAMFDIKGKTHLVSKQTNKRIMQLDISSVPSGIYFVRLTGDDFIQTHRLVKRQN